MSVTEPRQSPPDATHAVCVAEFAWHDLRFRVVTPDPLTDDERRVIEGALPKIGSVGRFADVLGIVLGRRGWRQRHRRTGHREAGPWGLASLNLRAG